MSCSAPMTAMPEKVIFACVHNAGRSQMAAAFFGALADPRRARALSAGTSPGERVHPEVIEAMHEVGIDLSGNRPQLLTSELAQGAAHLVTMGCAESSPARSFPARRSKTGRCPTRKGSRSSASARSARKSERSCVSLSRSTAGARLPSRSRLGALQARVARRDRGPASLLSAIGGAASLASTRWRSGSGSHPPGSSPHRSGPSRSQARAGAGLSRLRRGPD